MIRAADVREKFPNPRRFMGLRFTGDDYCVGFAACKYADAYRYHRMTIKDGLVSLNPTLPSHMADEFVRRIVHANDAGYFEEAWEILDKALTYGRPESVVKNLIESAEEVTA